MNASPLPFTVSVLETMSQKTPELLMPILEARSASYSRHLPDVGKLLLQPEPDDLFDDSVLFTIHSKMDRRILGGFRYQTNRKHKLPLECAVELPEHQKKSLVCEANRFFILPPKNEFLSNNSALQPLVRLALFKIFFEKARADGMKFMTVTARPPIDRNYVEIGFSDLYENKKLYPTSKIGGIGHRVLTLPVDQVTDSFLGQQFPILGHFIFRQIHPDLPQYDIKPVLVAPDVISEDFLDFSKTTLKPLMLDLELPF